MAVHSIIERIEDFSLGRLRWLEAGEGPPLVLLHGMGVYSSAGIFEPIMPLLAPRFRVIAPDLLGFGKGIRVVEEGPTFELMLEHLREFLDRRGLLSVSLLGHSMGGWVAGLLAYQSPSRIRRLMLLCAAGMNEAPANGIRQAVVPSAADLEQTFRRAMTQPQAADPEMIGRAARTAHEMASMPDALEGIQPLLRQMETPSVRARYKLQRRLPFIRVPTALVWGEGDVFEPYPTWNAEWAAIGGDVRHSSKPWMPPDARFIRLPTGHFPQIENPALTAKVISEFFA